MHELYIAECILKSVADSLPPGMNPQAVEEVRVQLGKLDAVVPDTLTFLFDAIKTNGGMPNARLALSEIEVVCRCENCENEFGIEVPVFLCPSCGSGNVKVLRGRGITLTGIQVKDENGEDDGNSGNS
ncbi:hydrogenase maturation nickel metallochaperone HypA [bacterium]|nr:hydrogenase maturation nickel metallochaperone HypA [bacterium]MBU1983990.1 hydrogenase maturation nickel metallochaperone HypA [bacterium]